jgi:hypothetical protein
MQLFQITPNKEAISVKAYNSIRDNLRQDGVYLIVDDNKKIIWIYKGQKAPILLQFYGALLQKEMLMSLKSTYHSNDLNKFHKDSDIFTEVMDSIIKSGLSPEIRKKQEPEQGPGEAKRRAFMTYATSRMQETCVHTEVSAKEVIPQIIEFENPVGYKRHMSMITGSMYNEDLVIEKFISDSKTKINLTKIGTLPNGFYFLENMSSRLFIKDGKVACLDYMVEENKDLGENRVLVPVLHQEKIHREGDIKILLNAFKAQEK